MRSGERQDVANEMNQEKPRFNRRFMVPSVHFDSNLLFGGHILISVDEIQALLLPARSRARTSARLVNSLTIDTLYSAGPRRSELGCAASAESWAAWLIWFSSIAFPTRKPSALAALIGIAPTFVSPIPARRQTPAPST